MTKITHQHANYTLCRKRNLRALAYLAVLLSCGVFLAGGFVYAARRHFAAVEYGYHSEELRRERDRLMEARARLLLQFEEAASPIRLEQAARALGLQPVRPAQINQVKESLTPTTAAAAATLSDKQPSTSNASALTPALISPASATRHR